MTTFREYREAMNEGQEPLHVVPMLPSEAHCVPG